MNLLILLSTAIAVSVDSFVCGFSLPDNNNKPKTYLTIFFVVFIMCLITDVMGIFCKGIIPFDVSIVGGIVLCIIALQNAIDVFKKTDTNAKITDFLIGFGVGLDGAYANFSLAVMGIHGLIVPLLIATFHVAFIYFGAKLSNISYRKLSKYKIIPPTLLFAIGVYRIVCCLI